MLRLLRRKGEEREPETAPEELRSDVSARPAPQFRRLNAREEYMLLNEFEGMVLTSEEGIVDLNDAAREVVALLENNGEHRLVVSDGKVLHPSVAYVMEQAWAHGVEIDSYVIAMKSTLVQLYALTLRRTREDVLAGDLSEAEHNLSGLLNDAAQKRVTDIHIAVEQLETKVYYRLDGMMERIDTWSRAFGESVLRRAYLACDESEGGALRLKEHHGARMTGVKFPLPFGVQAIRLQFNSKASDCYYLVLRLLHEESLEGEGDIDDLGYAGFQVDAIRQARTKPFGLAIIAGVTGSGKSTTLQRNLQSLIRERGTINVITIEDPPEYRIQGAHQLPVTGDRDERAVGFAAAITASLRSDPDVIMIGEVRERESALLAVKATMTGHAVWTTVHASSAAGSLERLIAEGVPEHRLLDPSVASILIAQRLVQRVCPSCSMHWQDERLDMERLEKVPGFLPRLVPLLSGRYARALNEWVRVRNEPGCDAKGCRRGYVGRTLIAEVVPVDKEYLDVYRDRGASAAEAFWASEKEGMRMHEHGMMKVLAGQIDPLDLYYVAGIPDSTRVDVIFAHAHREGLIQEVL